MHMQLLWLGKDWESSHMLAAVLLCKHTVQAQFKRVADVCSLNCGY